MLLSKISRGKELGVDVTIDKNSSLSSLPSYLDYHDLVVIIGNLIENAYDPFANVVREVKEIYISILQSSEIETVRFFLQNGAFDYIMKPFRFERMKQSLEKYKQIHMKLRKEEEVTQQVIDELFYPKNVQTTRELPKGLNAGTLNKILTYLQQSSTFVTAEDVAESVGMARVTTRRYLEYLEQIGKVELQAQYGTIGRPVNRYLFIRK
ncbi:MAG: FaeA/PapI family transcriptional regulator [Bacillaceae bacterium]